MCDYYRFDWCALQLLLMLLLLVSASAASARGDPRQPAALPPAINHRRHQSASAASEESFSPLSAYDGGGGEGVGRGRLFSADEAEDEAEEFAPTLPIPEKQVLELAGLTATAGTGPSRSQDADERHPAAQKLYPTFFRNIPPLGHSRPYYQSTEAAIEQRFNKLRAPALSDVGSPLLGSGDFGVIKGGTFYYDTDGPSKPAFADEFYGLGYNNNNGHGRPQLAYLVQKPPAQKEEQFSNFRDFADINISNDPAYSHHAPLYAALPAASSTTTSSSSSSQSRPHEPENILDELRLLDHETTTAATSEAATSLKGRGKAKKSTLVERKKRPKSAKGQLDAADDYMLASS